MILAAPVAIALVIACGGSSKSGTSTTPGGSAPAASTPTAAAPASSAPAPPPPPAGNSIGEGTWSVPDQVKPGTYRTTVPADSFGCYWARLKDLSGGADAIIANGTADKGASTNVRIAATDKGFQSQGCGTWTKVG